MMITYYSSLKIHCHSKKEKKYSKSNRTKTIQCFQLTLSMLAFEGGQLENSVYDGICINSKLHSFMPEHIANI